MTINVSETIENSVKAFATREGISPETAAERLIGYGLRAVHEHDDLTTPRPYWLDTAVITTTEDGEEAISESWEWMWNVPTFDDAKAELLGVVRDAGGDLETAERAIAALVLMQPVRLNVDQPEVWRIRKAGS